MATRWLTNDQQNAWRAYLVGTTLLMERLDRDLREKHDLSLPEYEILVRLSEAPGKALRMADLAHQVKNSRSRITHTIARMECEKLVERRQCPSDGRGVMASLTEVGMSRLEAAAPSHVAAVREAFVDVIADPDLAVVGRAFRKVADRLEQGSPDPILENKSA